MKQTSLTKQDLSILIGNCLDHFDTALYGFLAPILANIFFPTNDPIISLILAYSVLATSILNRPLGTYFFSIVAKNNGASVSLSYSLIGVALTTIAIGVIPSYKSIGWVAPIMLIIIRIMQGIFAEGEATIAGLYILENKIDNIAFKASYLYQTSTILGCIAASSVSTILISSSHHEYWRLCFIAGGIIGIIGVILRRYALTPKSLQGVSRSNPENSLKKLPNLGLPRSASSLACNDEISNTHSKIIDNIHPLLSSLWIHKYDIAKVSIISGMSYITYIIPFIVMNSFIPFITTISLEIMMAFNTILLVIDMLLIPIIGHVSAKFNPYKTMKAALIVIIGTTLPIWYYLDNASLWYVNFVRLWIIIWGIVLLCPINIWCNNLFNNSDKYLLVGIGKALGSSFIGRLTAPICLGLWHLTNNSLVIGSYITLVAIGGIWALNQTSLRGVPTVRRNNPVL